MPLSFDDIPSGKQIKKTNSSALLFDDLPDTKVKSTNIGTTPANGKLSFDDIPTTRFNSDNAIPDKFSLGETFGRIALSPAEPLKRFIRDPAMLTRTIPETLGGKSPKEKIVEKFGKKPEGERWTPAFLRSFGTSMVGDVANIATSPTSYLPIPVGKTVGKLVGKIPIRGTTLGEIATKLPFKEVFKKDVAERVAYQTALKTLPARVASSQAPLKGAIEAITPVNKIIQALKEAKPLRGQQETLYSAERAKRFGAAKKSGLESTGEAGFYAEKGQLGGELPKLQFEPVRNKITQLDIDDLFNTIKNNPDLTYLETFPTRKGLLSLLEGSVPTEGELKLLSKVFPSDFIKVVAGKKSLLQNIWGTAEDVINLPKAYMATGDLSGTLRQGFFLSARHPIKALGAFKEELKYFFSEKAYQGLIKDIRSRPTFTLMEQNGLQLTDILTSGEEKFLSNLAERLPGKSIIRASNRAYTGFLNKLRADTFDYLVNKNKLFDNPVELKGIAGFLNNATGRGKLGVLEDSAKLINGLLFSPRLQSARIALMNPVYYATLPPIARKEALQSLFAFTGTVGTILGIAKMNGAEVETNPNNANFLKIKVGNTRYDVAAGYQQYIRLASQLISGEHISSTTGVKTTFGEGYKPLTRADIVGRFFETKESPVLSFATALLRGQNAIGKKLDIPKEAAQRFIPMVAQDMYDLVKEKGLEGIAMGVPAVFGVGVQTYSPDASEMVHSANSVLNNAKQLFKQGRIKEAKNLINKNTKIIEIGKTLEPIQKKITKFENTKETIKKNVTLSTSQKEQTFIY